MNRQQVRTWWLSAVLALLAGLAAPAARAQMTPPKGFTSGSTGADGALTLTTTQMSQDIDFNPKASTPPLDPSGDNVFNFTSVTIGPNVTLHLKGRILGTQPVVWLCSGPVRIDGIVDLNGEDTPANPATHPTPAYGGAGGYGGGVGGDAINPPKGGDGPGGGSPAVTNTVGGGAGYAIPGGTNNQESPGGPAYGNVFLLPLVGGSGGGGGAGSGGGGGGALLIVSSVSITVNGTIRANGGSGAPGNTGGGSGGAIRLMAPVFDGNGTLQATGGAGAGGDGGAVGRIRFEAFQNLFTGAVSPMPAIASGPGVIAFPPGSLAVRVTSVAGQSVSMTPTGSFEMPDAVINSAGSVPVQIEAHRIPVGTVVHLRLVPDSGSPMTVDSTALAGTLDTSTATAMAKFPHGFTRVFMQATFTPPQ